MTIHVADADTNSSDPCGKASQCERKPPLNAAAQLFCDGYVLSMNFELHLAS